MATKEFRITEEIIQAHGFTPTEYLKVLDILGREPNITELGIFSVMWSEHCSYKSSKKWLKTLPTKAPWVICGPGENAGVVDIGDGQAAVFKMESHNHPSFIEPYQGAATGVGGILRDVFTMGARPVGNLNALRFGSPDHFKTRHLLSGVVAGIGNYGNCVGVPTLGGECEFHHSYNGNILVNAMTVGVVKQDRIFYSAASGPGNSIVYVGSKTGRDGIHGATMASSEFAADADEKRPTVQVGDPFTEKLLIEACLELMGTDCIVSIQDMGAAGLTSSSFEMASKGGVGISLDLDKVPQREENMTPYEIMLSESQERMLMVLNSGSEDRASKIFKKWELDFAVIGEITSSGRLELTHMNKLAASLPIDPLASASPEYDRPWSIQPTPKKRRFKNGKVLKSPLHALTELLSSPNLCSKKWIWEQYDHMVMADTLKIGRPGGDAAMVRVHNTNKALAFTSDSSPRYCVADPVEGGRQVVAEAYRNITATGAFPLAITDNLNFGNPEKPKIMGQFVGCIMGMSEACKSLDFPVVSGNVSFYNETNGEAILPTPTIGAVGLISDSSKAVGIGFCEEGESILLVGRSNGHLECSLYSTIIEGFDGGAPPKVDLGMERCHGDFVREMINSDLASACHDISDGGLMIAISEMALAGNKGCKINYKPTNLEPHQWAFGEDQGRYILTTKRAEKVIMNAKKLKIPIQIIGVVSGQSLHWVGNGECSLSDIRSAHENWLPEFMENS